MCRCVVGAEVGGRCVDVNKIAELLTNLVCQEHKTVATSKLDSPQSNDICTNQLILVAFNLSLYLTDPIEIISLKSYHVSSTTHVILANFESRGQKEGGRYIATSLT